VTQTSGVTLAPEARSASRSAAGCERVVLGVCPKGDADPDARLAAGRARRGEQTVESSQQAQPSAERPRLTGAVARVAADLDAVDANIEREVDSSTRHQSSIGHEAAPRIVATPIRHPQRFAPTHPTSRSEVTARKLDRGA